MVVSVLEIGTITLGSIVVKDPAAVVKTVDTEFVFEIMESICNSTE